MVEYRCPHCRTPIYDDDALLCLYCGQSLDRGRRLGIPKPLLAVLVAVLVLAFVLSLVF